MKKKLGVVLLMGLLCFGTTSQIYANEPQASYVYEVQPRFKDINTIKYDFYFDGDEAIYGAVVSSSSSYKIEIYLELQKLSGNTWEKVKSSSDYKNSRVFAYEDTKIVDTSETYRVYYKITAYYGAGKSETVTKYKY